MSDNQPPEGFKRPDRYHILGVMDYSHIAFWIGLVITGLGFLLLWAGGICFRWRAYRNLPAWDGATRPLLRWGLAVSVIGLAIFVPVLYHLYSVAS
ncbi:hypothetical protein [Bifidobacterium psychraerophilum]|jgi:hypothetical protein|uniref:hypothetical protein n=2 Tax=Bifidobacterium psychraerophilum TaxID=218140 RepID=UPI0023F2B181|nr:hypothetical protein [Bifidobacterium psychraerophilum]MCI1659848.1 hypothetical protein [Bifidobacterium psychraerophilum]MCI1805601.1 hypothetical protein [Bifidobacterium psychraerophilum]MCI2177255.1 hypothetical protein [Bifidobacterium psychraerophilum]